MQERSEVDPTAQQSETDGRSAPPPIASEDLKIGDPVDTSALDAALVARLSFDGYKLRWHATAASEWTAFSGAADESARESQKGIGPTPQGHFTIDPSDIETFDPSDDWGSHRVRLQPLAATVKRMSDCFKLIRTGMYVHGGTVKGTHGCIELNGDTDEEAFFATLKAYGRPIDLEVKYTGARESAYEEQSCPY